MYIVSNLTSFSICGARSHQTPPDYYVYLRLLSTVSQSTEPTGHYHKETFFLSQGCTVLKYVKKKLLGVRRQKFEPTQVTKLC